MVALIEQGDVFWINFGEPRGSEPGYRHPHVVIQNNLFNLSKLNTVVVCVLTPNLQRAQAPGNVLLNAGEANLPQASVVNVTQLFTVDKHELAEWIGRLSASRVRQILRGVQLFLEPRDIED